MDPTSLIWALVLIVTSYAVQALTATRPNRPTDAAPAQLGDFKLPTAAEGTPQIIVFGDCWVEDWTVLWYGNLSNEPIYADDAGGGGKK